MALLDISISANVEAVKNNGFALEYADKLLRKDKKIVLEAVKQNCYALEYADSSLKKNKEVVLEAIKNDVEGGMSLESADNSLKKDKKFMLKAVKVNAMVLELAHISIRKTKRLF